MVMAQSLFKTIKADQPDALIDVLAPAWSLPLLKRMPEVNQGLHMPIGHGSFSLMERYRVGYNLQPNAYTQAIVTPRSLKSALVPFFARIPVRTGYRGEMRFGLINDMRKLKKSVLTQTVQRQVALGLDKTVKLPPPIPAPRLTVDKQNQQRLLEKFTLHLDRPVVGLIPGAAYGPAKQWPLENFRKLATQLVNLGKQVWVIGSENEIPLGDSIAALHPDAIFSLCGRTRLEDAIDLMDCMQSVVTNDSGLMHVACAVDKPVIAIYGSSSPAYTPPLSDKAKILYLDLSCSPCFKRQCPLGHTKCLADITPAQVLEKLP